MRNTDDTLGLIIKTTMNERVSAWIPPTRTQNVASGSSNVVKPDKKGGGNNNPKKTGDGQSPKKDDRITVPDYCGKVETYKGIKMVFGLRDGAKICRDYNIGSCPKVCPKHMIHICARLTKSGQPCKMKNHRAMECYNPKCG